MSDNFGPNSHLGPTVSIVRLYKNLQEKDLTQQFYKKDPLRQLAKGQIEGKIDKMI